MKSHQRLYLSVSNVPDIKNRAIAPTNHSTKVIIYAVDVKNGKIVTTAFVFCLDEMCRETLPPIAWRSVAKHDKASHIQLQAAGNA